jgi:hypothetical protein
VSLTSTSAVNWNEMRLRFEGRIEHLAAANRFAMKHSASEFRQKQLVRDDRCSDSSGVHALGLRWSEIE